jgi:hypothetical protein
MASPSVNEIYVNCLTAEGFTPTIDKDSDIEFVREGLRYFIIPEDRDPHFFRLLLPIWECDRASLELLTVCNDVTASSKVVKIYIRQDRKSVEASVELFFQNRADFAPVFKRSLRAIDRALGKFMQAMTPPAQKV